MAVLFFLGTAVQYNDPDPWRWVAVYGGATLACALHLARRLPRWLPVVLGGVSFVWGVLLLPGVLGKVCFVELFQEIGMDSPEIEVGRETFGLLLIAGWMVVLAVDASRRSSTRVPSP